AVHDGENACLLRTAGCLLIDHALLKPESRKLQPDAVIDDRRYMLRLAEYVHDVHLFAGRKNLTDMVQIGNRTLAEDGIDAGIHRDHPITKALQVARD